MRKVELDCHLCNGEGQLDTSLDSSTPFIGKCPECVRGTIEYEVEDIKPSDALQSMREAANDALRASRGNYRWQDRQEAMAKFEALLWAISELKARQT